MAISAGTSRRFAYNQQSFLHRESAHDGFHEAVGDTIALSVTPEYLKKVGLLDRVSPPSADIALLLRDALEHVAFVPFGIVVDRWRWQVFSGATKPADYNAAWWKLREQYQGVAAPVARSEQDFDPGAKYHVPGNTSYTAISWRASWSSSSTATSAAWPATKARCTAAPSTATSPPARA